MKYKKNKLSLLLLGIGITLQAQQANTASGGDASGIGGTVAYSIGQVVYITNSNVSGTLSQGVQQAYEIFTLGIKESELNISLSAFPNPTSDNLTLQIKNYNNEKLSYQLFDMQGKLLNNEQITGQQTQINIESYPIATYFVHVRNQENKHVSSFKFIKN
jgi:hypothetical protein